MPTQRASSIVSLSFDEFWGWLVGHLNCIVRAGSREAMFFDHQDFHWHVMMMEEPDVPGGLLHILQLRRGKELVGDLTILSGEIGMIQCYPGPNDEYVCEALAKSGLDEPALYQFVMEHPIEEHEVTSEARWTH